jgi:N-methylhydantoinase A
MMHGIGVDIGGTFTDLVLAGDDGVVDVVKVPTNRERPEAGVYHALEEAAALRGTSVEDLLGATTTFVHGTTIATNTIVERNGPRIGLLATEGHRDALMLRDGVKPERFNLRMDPPDPFVPRYLRRGVSGRIDYRGQELQAIDEGALDEVLADFEEAGVESIAVALLWSNQNDAHERQVLERIKQRLPEASVCLSSEVLPVIGEWKRTSATVLSAYVKPGLADYLGALEADLRRDGLGPRLLIMQANGGAATADVVDRRAVFAVGSGPAAAPAAALRVAAEYARDNLIAVDMGGTSFDVAMIRQGQPTVTSEFKVMGLPLGVDALEIVSVGAGGGSIAWIDSGGALRVGPESARSTPGPACYGRGGVRPTVTDADLVLGYLDPSNPLGGRLNLDPSAAEAAIRAHVAEPLGIDVGDAAAAIFDVVNHNMVEAIRMMSIARGTDPRGFSLVLGGGAGAVHGGHLAQVLDIEEAIAPRESGAICAMGMVAADVRHDYVMFVPTRGDDLSVDSLAALDAAFESLETGARADLRSEGFADERMTFVRTVDARYRNQFHDLNVSAPAGTIDTAAYDEIVESFHAAHEHAYTYALRHAPVDVLHVRVAAFGRVATLPAAADPGEGGDPEVARRGERPVRFPGADFTTTPVYVADGLRPGMRIEHPAIIERSTTTVVVFPGLGADVGQSGALRLYRLRGARAESANTNPAKREDG